MDAISEARTGPGRQAGRARAALLAVAAVLVLAAALAWQLLRAEPAPAVTYSLIDGTKVSQQQLLGKVVLVNFWATSCTSCIREMPGLAEMHRKFQDRGFETIAVAMSYDRPDYVVNYATTRQLPFKVALDTQGQIAAGFGQVAVTPTSFLIGRDGTILKRWVGEPDFAELHALIAARLEG